MYENIRSHVTHNMAETRNKAKLETRPNAHSRSMKEIKAKDDYKDNQGALEA